MYLYMYTYRYIYIHTYIHNDKNIYVRIGLCVF